jgi:D-alanyl-D-alanine carboxypeptidase
LVGSANSATMALVNATGLTPDDFVARMNERAAGMGLTRTSFVDPIGLSGYNVSTAGEVTRLAAAALDVKEIGEATLTNRYDFTTAGGRKVSVTNTDSLLDIFPQNGLRITGGKTGYTESAGYCFTGRFTDAGSNEIVSAVLGTGAPNLRFSQTRGLVEWVYGAYDWPER